MFSLGLALFTVGSAAAALAPSIGALVAARALQGAGGALVTPLTLTLLSEAFPAGRRGVALGIWSGISGLGVALVRSSAELSSTVSRGTGSSGSMSPSAW